MTLASLKFTASSHEEHRVELEREPGSRHYVVKVDGDPVWERQAGLFGFTDSFPLLGCRCSVQAITLGALFTRHRLSVQCTNNEAYGT